MTIGKGTTMRNSIKLIISLFACGLMLLSGCGSTPTTSLPNELVGQKNNYPKSVNIIAPNFFKKIGTINAETAKQQWLDEMSERYGVKFNIFTSEIEAKNNNSSSGSVSGQSKEFVGLTSINSFYDLKSGIKNGSYLPLDSYLEANPVWNALPEEFKSLFEVDGHIYAIPASASKAQKARIIHDEALQETGLSVTDLDSFYNFAVAYEKIAGIGTGRGRSTGSYMESEIKDIFNAFGLYPSNDEHIQFSYDPTADCYVDWLTKDTAASALEYLRELSTIHALGPADMDEIAPNFDNGLFASKYAPYLDYDNCTEVLTLNSEYPQVLLTDISGFAMTVDTPQPKETINLLIDMLFGSEQNYLQCWLGSAENYTLNSDGTITIKLVQDSGGNYVAPAMPNLASDLSDIFPCSDADLIYNNNAEKNEARLKVLNDSLKNGLVVEIPLAYQMIKSPTYDAGLTGTETDIGFLYIACFFNAIYNPDKTVQQIVDEYKAAMLALGGNQMLDEMNAAIGKTTAYYYG